MPQTTLRDKSLFFLTLQLKHWYSTSKTGSKHEQFCSPEPEIWDMIMWYHAAVIGN